MNWVTIDQEKCNQCGICARRCPRCYTNNDGVITVQADEECCNLCGHCVALCKTSAITHSRMDMDNFPPVGAPIHWRRMISSDWSDSEEATGPIRKRPFPVRTWKN